jgi:uncharacterized iron-regulated membrane protein
VLFLFFIYWLATGIFLQVRKPVDWIQPPSQKGVSFKKYTTSVTPDQILQAAKSIPEAKVDSWEDILLLDVRLKNGMVKVRTYDFYEVQVDTTTGEVLSHNQRWNDIIGAWHSGAIFGGFGLFIFFVMSILITILTASGGYLVVQATMSKLKDAKMRKQARKLTEENGMTPMAEAKEPFNLVKFCLKYHYYFSFAVFLPYMIVAVTGVMLELRDLKGEYPSLQGGSLATVQGSGAVPTLTYYQVVEIAKTIPELQVKKPKHIFRIYNYPNEGIISIRAKRHVAKRAQIDAITGEVLDVGPFTSDYWEDWHQGLLYEVTGDRKKKSSFKLDLITNVFLWVHILSFLFWALGTVAVLRQTVFKPKN